MLIKWTKKGGIVFFLLIISHIYLFGGNNGNVSIDKTQSEKGLIPFKRVYKITESKKAVSPLSVMSHDILWEFGPNGKYVDLIIRKKKSIRSVMLTNMYYGRKHIQEYGRKAYGLRARTYNPVNGKELRIVGYKKYLGGKPSQYFIVDSHPERHSLFGWAFRLRIPRMVEFGYKSPGENYGIIVVEKGVTINLRCYSRKYANNRSGKYQNNPLTINFTQKDYIQRLRPVVTKIDEYDEAGYRVVVVRYSSRVNYIKYFLVRDMYQGRAFRRISFANHQTRRDKTAVVLRAIHKQGSGIVITASLYFKKGVAEKEYDISGVDHGNRIAKNYISVVVPQFGKKIIHKERNNNVAPSDKDSIPLDDDGRAGEEHFFK